MGAFQNTWNRLNWMSIPAAASNRYFCCERQGSHCCCERQGSQWEWEVRNCIFLSCFPALDFSWIIPSILDRQERNFQTGIIIFSPVTFLDSSQSTNTGIPCDATAHISAPSAWLIRRICTFKSILLKSNWSYSVIMWHMHIGQRQNVISNHISLTPIHAYIYICWHVRGNA